MITLTPQAAQQVHKAAEQTGAQGNPLRIAARADADGSIQYGMGFDEQREHDMLIHCEGDGAGVAGQHFVAQRGDARFCRTQPRRIPVHLHLA